MGLGLQPYTVMLGAGGNDARNPAWARWVLVTNPSLDSTLVVLSSLAVLREGPLLVGLGTPYGKPGVEPQFTVCKAGALPHCATTLVLTRIIANVVGISGALLAILRKERP